MTTILERADRPMRRLSLAVGLWVWGVGMGGDGLLRACGVDGAAPPAAIREGSPIRIGVSFGRELGEKPVDGRLLVMLSTDDKAEPRFQISDGPKTQQIFGIDVDGLAPDQEAVIDEKALGYPVESLSRVPPGKYRVQAVLHKYETFHRADGHTVKLPMDRGEGQQWTRAPGNLYSTPREITIEPGAAAGHRRRSKSGSTRSSRRSPKLRPPSTSSTSESRASG